MGKAAACMLAYRRQHSNSKHEALALALHVGTLYTMLLNLVKLCTKFSTCTKVGTKFITVGIDRVYNGCRG